MAAENPSMVLDPKHDLYDFPTTAPGAQSGHPGHTTPEQDAQVTQLRQKLETDGYTERLDTLTLVCLPRRHFLRFSLLIRSLVEIPQSPQVRRQAR